LNTAELEIYLPVERFHTIVAGVLKQGVEKLDNVRQEAGICFMKLLNLALPDDNELDRWRLHGVKLLKELFPRWVISYSILYKIKCIIFLARKNSMVGMMQTGCSLVLSASWRSEVIANMYFRVLS